MSVEECADCGILFGITQSFHNRLVEEKRGYYCPNGHSLVYRGKKEEDILRAKLKIKNRDIETLHSIIDKAERKICKHTWTIEIPTHCIKCGIPKDFKKPKPKKKVVKKKE